MLVISVGFTVRPEFEFTLATNWIHAVYWVSLNFRADTKKSQYFFNVQYWDINRGLFHSIAIYHSTWHTVSVQEKLSIINKCI